MWERSGRMTTPQFCWSAFFIIVFGGLCLALFGCEAPDTKKKPSRIITIKHPDAGKTFRASLDADINKTQQFYRYPRWFYTADWPKPELRKK